VSRVVIATTPTTMPLSTSWPQELRLQPRETPRERADELEILVLQGREVQPGDALLTAAQAGSMPFIGALPEAKLVALMPMRWSSET
jgi:hypothetical protein